MKIYTRIEWQWDGARYVMADADSYEYSGPLAMCTGAEAAPAVAEGAKAAGTVAASEVGAATLMPAAVAETAGTLAGWGLVETAPGVWMAAEAASGLSGISGLVNGAKTAATIMNPIASMAQLTGNKRIMPMTNRPAVTPPVTMPTFGSANQLNALRGNIQEQLVRRGRAATILTSETGSGNTLGN